MTDWYQVTSFLFTNGLRIFFGMYLVMTVLKLSGDIKKVGVFSACGDVFDTILLCLAVRQIGGYRQHDSVLFSSHILESICLTSDRVLVLEQGQIKKCFAGQEIEPGKIREALKE